MKRIIIFEIKIKFDFEKLIIITLKHNLNQTQLRLKSDDLAIVMTEIERMSDEDQKKKNMLFSTNAIQLMNAVKKNKAQKSLSKMIQNFENLFHQKLMKIEKADKIFVT